MVLWKWCECMETVNLEKSNLNPRIKQCLVLQIVEHAGRKPRRLRLGPAGAGQHRHAALDPVRGTGRGTSAHQRRDQRLAHGSSHGSDEAEVVAVLGVHGRLRRRRVRAETRL